MTGIYFDSISKANNALLDVGYSTDDGKVFRKEGASSVIVYVDPETGRVALDTTERYDKGYEG